MSDKKVEDLTLLTLWNPKDTKMCRFWAVVIITVALGKWFMSINNHYMFEYKWKRSMVDMSFWFVVNIVFWLWAIGLKIVRYLFASIMFVSSIQKCHNDSHRHGTILKEVAIIFSFDLYNRFDCFWHEQTHEWFCHSGLDHIQECDCIYGHRCPLP